MDFDFTDDQEQLRDAVRRWVDKGFSFERRHDIAKAGGQTRVLLGELTDLGLLGLQVDEAHGGLGFGPVEAMVVMEELGRGLVNAPYAQAALIAPLLLAQAPEALQAARNPCSRATASGLGVVRRKTVRMPDRAPGKESGRPKSPRTAVMPLLANSLMASLARTMTLKLVLRALRSRTSSLPILPVPPVTRIMEPPVVWTCG